MIYDICVSNPHISINHRLGLGLSRAEKQLQMQGEEVEGLLIGRGESAGVVARLEADIRYAVSDNYLLNPLIIY
jgi:hypothetical protein